MVYDCHLSLVSAWRLRQAAAREPKKETEGKRVLSKGFQYYTRYVHGAESAVCLWRCIDRQPMPLLDNCVETLRPDFSPCVCGPELSLLSPTYSWCYDGSREYLQDYSKPLRSLPMFAFFGFFKPLTFLLCALTHTLLLLRVLTLYTSCLPRYLVPLLQLLWQRQRERAPGNCDGSYPSMPFQALGL